jgi:alpha-1,2-mannosyltransferase
LGLAVALYAVSLVALYLSPMGHGWNFVDIYVYRQGGLAVTHGQGLYVADFNKGQLPFTYPPAAALFFSGLGLVSDYVSQIIATVCSLCLLPLALRFALRLRPFSNWMGADEATRLALACAAGAVWFEPVWTTLRYGQVNVLIAALILFDLSRPEGRRTKGMAIGLAAGLKVTPLIFIFYLFATGRRRSATTALGTLAGTIALSFALIPRDAWTYWVHDVLDASRPGKVENAADQNLRGALSRLLHTEQVEGLWLAAALVTVVVGLWLAVRAARRGEDEASGYALCSLTGLLVSPISWTHHWVEAVPALTLVLLRAYRHRANAVLVACVAAVAVGCSQVTWRVPVSGFAGTLELHEHGIQLLASNAYVFVGLIALGWAAFAAWGGWRRERTAELVGPRG